MQIEDLDPLPRGPCPLLAACPCLHYALPCKSTTGHCISLQTAPLRYSISMTCSQLAASNMPQAMLKPRTLHKDHHAAGIIVRGSPGLNSLSGTKLFSMEIVKYATGDCTAHPWQDSPSCLSSHWSGMSGPRSCASCEKYSSRWTKTTTGE